MSDFLPSGYDIPVTGGRYFKLQQGENRFRILDSPVVGNEFWVEENGKRQPVRRPMGQPITADESGGEQKHFWAMPVWSYRDNAVMIWEATQKGILKAIKELVNDEDWKNPRDYDFVITRQGEGMETEYGVKTKLPTPLSKDAALAWSEVQENGFDLKALFTGADPFSAGHTEIVFDATDAEAIQAMMEEA